MQSKLCRYGLILLITLATLGVKAHAGIWKSTPIFTASLSELQIGDGRNDGSSRIYGIVNLGSNDQRLYELSWNGQSWASSDLSAGITRYGKLVLGKGRNDAINRLYVLSSNSSDKGVTEYTWSGSSWDSIKITTDGYSSFGSAGIVLGEGRNDGIRRLYVAGFDFSGTKEYTWTGSSWTETAQMAFTASVIGSGRGDGVNRIYLYSSGGGNVQEYSWNGTTWTQTSQIGVSESVTSLVIGTGRNDGVNRLYIAPSKTAEYSWSGTEWTNSTLDLSGICVIADGRSDAVNRVYSIASSGGSYPGYEFTYSNSRYLLFPFVQFGNSPSSFVIGKGRNDGKNYGYVVALRSSGSGSELHELFYEPSADIGGENFLVRKGVETTINLSGGAKIFFPSNALSFQDAILNINTSPRASVPFDPHLTSVGTVISVRKIDSNTGGIDPYGASFNADATVTLPYDSDTLPAGRSESDLRLFKYAADRTWETPSFHGQGEWKIIANSTVDASAKTVSGQVRSFSDFSIMAYAAPAGVVQNFSNYPNPFSPKKGESTRIRYVLDQARQVRIRIYDPFGGLVFDESGPSIGVPADPGPNELLWNGAATVDIFAIDRYAAPGIYIGVLEVEGTTLKTKIVVK